MSEAQLCPLSRDQWLALAPTFADYNYRQAWEYGLALAQRRGATCEHVGIRFADEWIALADVRLKPTPVLGGGIAYISGGPLMRRSVLEDTECLRDVLSCLSCEYAQRRKFVLRIQPPLRTPTWNGRASPQFEQLGFESTDRSQRYRTLVVDIARPLPAIRASLAQKWRNCLNAAERNGLTVSIGSDDGAFEKFCDLFSRFHVQKGFSVDLDADFYRALQRDLSEGDRMIVSLASQDGKVVAGHVSSMLGDTCVYLLGATDAEGLRTKAAYLLQWTAITAAHQRGLWRYDLGGIDPEGNPGVYHFKSGLGGHDICCAGPFEFAPPSWRANLTLHAERVYRSVKQRTHAKVS